MPYSLNFIRHGDYLEVVVSGTVDGYDELLAKAQEIIKRVRAEGARTVLLDERLSRPAYGTHDVLMLSDRLAEDGLQAIGVKAAALFNPDNETLSRVFETSFRNRSVNYRVFRERKMALSWLLS